MGQRAPPEHPEEEEELRSLPRPILAAMRNLDIQIQVLHSVTPPLLQTTSRLGEPGWASSSSSRDHCRDRNNTRSRGDRNTICSSRDHIDTRSSRDCSSSSHLSNICSWDCSEANYNGTSSRKDHCCSSIPQTSSCEASNNGARSSSSREHGSSSSRASYCKSSNNGASSSNYHSSSSQLSG